MTIEEKREKVKQALLLYGVTDRAWVGNKTFEEQIEDSLKGGVTCIQLREKSLKEDEFLEEAKVIKKLTKKYQIPLIINDNVEIALASDADGVHVGQKDARAMEVRKKLGADKIIGVSARTVEQAKEAEQMGADYLGVGAVFGTTTKGDSNNPIKTYLTGDMNFHRLPHRPKKNINVLQIIPQADYNLRSTHPARRQGRSERSQAGHREACGLGCTQGS